MTGAAGGGHRAARPASIVLALLMAACGPAGASQPPPAAEDTALAGRQITQLVVEGVETLSAETVLFYLGLRVGDPWDPAALDRRLRELWQRGLVDDLTIESEAVAGGVRLLVQVEERPTVRSIEYRGLERVREPQIAERLEREGIRLAVGGPLQRGELRRLEAAVEELYREKGFSLVSVGARSERLARAEAAVVVEVSEGERLKIGAVGFAGNTVFTDARLRRALKESRPGFLARVGKKNRFDRAALARDLERVRELYRRAGYKDAAVSEPRLEVIERQGRRGVEIVVTVEEGERWRLGGISFSGNRELSDELLLRQFERPASGWLESRFIDEGADRLRELYGRGGYITARVAPRLVERPQGVADLVVEIDEGEQFRVGRIEVAGNTETREKVIRRELAVQEGQILDTVALRRGLLRLRQLEFFEFDAEEPVRFDLREEDREVDLLVSGRESDRVNLFFGGGYSEAVGLFGQFQYASRNFLGRGETLSTSLQAGADVTFVQAGYSLPWFLDRPQSVGAELFLQSRDLRIAGESRRQELEGLRLSWGRRLAPFQSLSLGYTFQDVLDRRQRAGTAGLPIEQLVDRRVSALELAWRLDRVDSRFEPTRGLRLRGALEAAGGAIGGDSRYLEARAGLSLFRPLAGAGLRPVFGFNLEAGAVRPLGGGVLTFSERFYLGGENSLRGFDPVSEWARGADGQRRVDADGFGLGGDRFLETSVELHLQLAEPLRLVVFADAGGVWAEDQSFDLGGLRAAAGLELRLMTPLLPHPLRLIWAENLDPLPGDEFDSFSFAFGASF